MRPNIFELLFNDDRNKLGNKQRTDLERTRKARMGRDYPSKCTGLPATQNRYISNKN